jgi:FKBP-type peptidyl-prolyl cis-trans isomerase FkpA
VRFRFAGVALLAFVFMAACGYSDPYASSGPIANESPAGPSPGADDFHAGDGLPKVTFPDGLQYIDITQGTGNVARVGSIATVQYTGWLTDGTRFDTSRQTGRAAFSVLLATDPATCKSGTGYQCVISGWDEGVSGMAAGGRRKLIIPSALAYGTQGQQDSTGATIIPPNATLVFEIELVSVTPGPRPTPTPKK